VPVVLLVEDEPAIADAAAWALERSGCTVRRAATIAEARVGVDARPDILVLDLGLPDGDGLDLLRSLGGRLPVVVLTARADEIDRIVGLELGADDYLAKPFSPRELAARVRAVLRRSAAQPARGGLTIDHERQRATWDGRPLDLTRQQLRILATLVERPGVVFSRSSLLDRCWDEPSERFDRAVDSQVKLLRAALRAAGADDGLVETVRGEGYRWRDG
jgi:two-component system catabolic regulation response regulator CreB